MFETVLGIPAHPLLVHAAVVFVPLQAISGVVYAFLPSLRPKIAWAVAALVVIGPGSAWLARLSGTAFRDRLVRNGVADPVLLGKIDEHFSFGNVTSWLVIALAVATVLLMVVSRQPSATGGATIIGWVLRLAVLAAAAITGYYVFRTGDTGAHIVWAGF